MVRFALRLVLLAAFLFIGGVIYIRLAYGCSWKDSVEIADQFVTDLVG